MGGSIAADGQVYVTTGSVTVSGSYQAGSTSQHYYSTLNLDGPVVSLGDVTVDDIATLDLDPSSPQVLSVGTLSLTNASTIAGSDSLTVNGLMTWTDSTVNITGTITLLGGAVVSDGATLAGGTLVAPSPVQSGDGSGITVTGGGTVDPTPPQNGPPPPPVPVNLEGGTLAGSGTLNSTLTNNGLVSPGGPGAAATIDLLGDYTQTGSGVFQVDVGANYDVLGVHGNISLDGTLQVSGLSGYDPQPNDTFVILNNEGTNPISGTFAGLPEGASFSAADGAVFQITYQGGANHNSVAITEINTPPSDVVLTPSSTSLLEGGTLTLGGSFVDPDPGQTHVVTINWGDGSPAWVNSIR